MSFSYHILSMRERCKLDAKSLLIFTAVPHYVTRSCLLLDFYLCLFVLGNSC